MRAGTLSVLFTMHPQCLAASKCFFGSISKNSCCHFYDHSLHVSSSARVSAFRSHHSSRGFRVVSPSNKWGKLKLRKGLTLVKTSQGVVEPGLSQ